MKIHHPYQPAGNDKPKNKFQILAKMCMSATLLCRTVLLIVAFAPALLWFVYRFEGALYQLTNLKINF